MVYNGGQETLNWFNLPWGGVRRTSMQDLQLGDLDYDQDIDAFSTGQTETFQDMGGWMLYADGQGDNDNALGLVMGIDKSPLPDWQYRDSFLNYGNNGGATSVTEDNWRNYLVTSFVRPIILEPGYCLRNRIYMVVGSADTVRTQIQDYNLVANADYDVYFNFAAESPILNWYKDSAGNPTTEPQNGQTPFYWTYRDPVRNNATNAASKAVFWIENVSTGEMLATTNPYELCTYNEDGTTVYRPYDGRTKYLGFLGYRF